MFFVKLATVSMYGLRQYWWDFIYITE